MEKGVPKIVMVITDGESDNNILTLTEARKLKDRGVNIVSIGVGDLKEQELIDMASSPNDVYKVDDFDTVLLILSSVSLTACQQPAVVEEEKEIKSVVEQDTYKYYKYSLTQKPEKFTIELEDLMGRSDLYYSFEDEMPKSPDDYIKQNETEPNDDVNFIEKNSIGKFLASGPKMFDDNKATSKSNKKYFAISRPVSGQNDFLYFGIKGIFETNEFKVYIYNRTVDPDPVEPPAPADYQLTILIIVVVMLFIVLLLVLIVLIFIIYFFKQKKKGLFNMYKARS